MPRGLKPSVLGSREDKAGEQRRPGAGGGGGRHARALRLGPRDTVEAGKAPAQRARGGRAPSGPADPPRCQRLGAVTHTARWATLARKPPLGWPRLKPLPLRRQSPVPGTKRNPRRIFTFMRKGKSEIALSVSGRCRYRALLSPGTALRVSVWSCCGLGLHERHGSKGCCFFPLRHSGHRFQGTTLLGAVGNQNRDSRSPEGRGEGQSRCPGAVVPRAAGHWLRCSLWGVPTALSVLTDTAWRWPPQAHWPGTAAPHPGSFLPACITSRGPGHPCPQTGRGRWGPRCRVQGTHRATGLWPALASVCAHPAGQQVVSGRDTPVPHGRP